MSVEEKRIKEFAYLIWESEGKPDGQEHRHWEMARKLAEAEALAPKSKPRKPQAAASAPPRAEPASAAKPEAVKKPRAPKKPASK
ncbi:hypothetical protein GCM10009504_44400 [Pseudomonas laurentiana]|uniref:DUF2934 domain-containing protein n=1 Tax=Pseudomonas laurentiana TaxID=2364649 RepID=A0A6I5RV77_9PSED|nr:DUF2934 domain-containing protein [Pseudomonas laurentiana]NES11506.1 DUF2934 domain-containing protein [Pseudomonas laurentiana]GGU83037.1 hypothetical protein GCM10009504_44400 [Pseudomonas laurentiana]